MTAVTDLAIVIVNYNVRDLLRRCLQTLFASDGVDFRVCVVDNNSPDDSAAMVQTEFPQVHLIVNRENVGYPAANNQGLRALGVDDGRRTTDDGRRTMDDGRRTMDDGRRTTTVPRYALLLNPDTELPPDGLAKIVAYMDAHPDIGVIGPKLVLPDGQLDMACRRAFPTPAVSFYRMVGLSRLFPHSPRFGRYNMTFLDVDEVAEVDSVVGAFMMVRGTAVQQAGLMDDQFWMYGEDLDWAKRIKDAGWRVVYYPEVTVLHVKRASSRQNPRAQVEFYRAMLIFYYKHYRRETGWLLHLFIVLGIALKGGPAVWPDARAGEAILKT
jgi:N-acetylglucosaminyl-diphospho-decaprenol L-rhamnosyltransferase